ncbi:uncharacterized protein LOC120085227 isoform X2 [Benincasa hispida]|uniref:uncharacterized protein LOC120085227 isoform X2 n=1 Tax=Benincasa hispida TaxID=102211 RepID=UPI0019009C10|nr:uncharacterized protein LOC120085227 isoform X2 [Benincasa hispida]
MGNVASSLTSGIFSAIGKVFGSPLDFLSGRSCSSVCGSTWDFICYIENFCVSNLLKMGMVLILSYFASYFYAWEYCCTFMCIKLASVKRTRRRHLRRRDLEEEFESEEGKCQHGSTSDSSNVPEHVESRSSRRACRRWRRNHRSSRMRKSLRPRGHGIRVRSGRVLVYGKHRRKSVEVGNHLNEIHSFGMYGSSKFVHKERKYRRESQR